MKEAKSDLAYKMKIIEQYFRKYIILKKNIGKKMTGVIQR